MTTIVDVLTAAKFLPEDAVSEFRRWGLVDEPVDTEPRIAATPGALDVLRQLDEVIQGEGYILTRETDLDALRIFSKERRTGVMVFVTPEGSRKTSTEYAVTPGGYLIPWPTDEVVELMTNGHSYLDLGKGKAHVYFSDSVFLYFDDERMFVRLVPAPAKAVVR